MFDPSSLPVTMDASEMLDLTALRKRLANRTGPAYWQGLRKLAEAVRSTETMQPALPEDADPWNDPTGRRRFLRIIGASLALAGMGLAGCDNPPEEADRASAKPSEGTSDASPFFATSFLLGGYAQGVLVESHRGRPIRIAGNPDHPASRGGTNVFMQGSVLDRYDPDRSQEVRHGDAASTWPQCVEALQAHRSGWKATGGRGLRILTETVTSPTLAAQLRTLLETFPEAQWHQYDPTACHNEREGIRRARGAYRQAVYRFGRADVVLSLDDDFLTSRPGSVRYAHDFADRRRVRAGDTDMNRLYVAESSSTVTGAMADHRLPARPRRIAAVARSIARHLGLHATAAGLPPEQAAWAEALARDLQEHAGTALVTAGPTMPPEIHELVHRMNDVLEGVGTTVTYIEPVEARVANHQASLRRLVDDMAAGTVETLVILGGNPAYTAPADVPFARHLPDVPTSVHLSCFVDETARACSWHVPRTHYLEQWGDARAYDGTASVLQPLVDPLYAPCRTSYDVLAVLNGTPDATSGDLVRRYWQDQYTGSAFDAFWTQTLRHGVVFGTGLPADPPPDAIHGGHAPIDDRATDRPVEFLRPEEELAPDDTTDVRPEDTTRVAIPPLPDEAPPDEDDTTVDLIFRPDPTVWDGRFAHNGWLQELPKPLTKLVWDNAALISPRMATRRGLQNRDVVELRHEDRTLRAPVWIVPGHPEGTVTVHLGYGRTQGGRAGRNAGFNAYTLRSSQAPWMLEGVQLHPTGATYELVSTQEHFRMEGDDPVRTAPIQRFRENPNLARDDYLLAPPSFDPASTHEAPRWDMAIDTNTCIGCNACVIACQVAHNVPVVGKDQVEDDHQTHELRVDRYYRGNLDAPETYFQPQPCRHCEARRTRDGETMTACQQACPTHAIVFGDLNDETTEVARWKEEPHSYELPAERGTPPRTTYLLHFNNPNPDMPDQEEENGDEGMPDDA